MSLPTHRLLRQTHAFPTISNCRRYAGIAFNADTQKVEFNQDTNVEGVPTIKSPSKTDLSAGLAGSVRQSAASGPTEVAAGINSASNWLKAPIQEEPEFKVVSAGPGSVLVVNVPPSSSFFARVGSALALSSGVEVGLSTEGGVVEGLSRKATGGAFLFNRLRTTNSSGDVVIAPKYIGDIASIKLDGGTEYYVRQEAFLAGSPRLSISRSAKTFGLGLDGLFNYRVKGKGHLAITTYGGLYRLVLAPGEEYSVNPKHIVAWDAALDPQTTITETVPPHTKTAFAEPTTKSYPERAWQITKTTVNRLSQEAYVRAKNWLIGDKTLYRLQGPGDFYIASRLKPKLAWLTE
ncbi:hypothetical protein HK097_009099 [Rhizophlyctis rosea]|uniref:Altered inheritance of mitochondria protein 24, mitochondrial n=1 Tax=Rhizophlyctis rosea TaxID=64517 RepID=A0AAD5S9D7_9FUNG|nr:hypothetical protein HK097_009099 [Rhizophlyctis rosea]